MKCARTYSEFALPLVEVDLLVVVLVGLAERHLDLDDALLLEVHFGEEAFVVLLEVVAELELGLGHLDVGLDVAVRVVDDGQEHVQEDEEREEHVADEVDRSQDRVLRVQRVEVEVAQNDTQQCVPIKST